MKFTLNTVLFFSLIMMIVGCEDKGSPLAPAAPPTVEVKFSTDVLPLLNAKGCVGCHGGNGGLTVGTVASLLTGGTHGPAVNPGKADSSNIILKLRGTASFGAQMPKGGPFLSTTEIKVFEDWINAGAKNN